VLSTFTKPHTPPIDQAGGELFLVTDYFTINFNLVNRRRANGLVHSAGEASPEFTFSDWRWIHRRAAPRTTGCAPTILALEGVAAIAVERTLAAGQLLAVAGETAPLRVDRIKGFDPFCANVVHGQCDRQQVRFALQLVCETNKGIFGAKTNLRFVLSPNTEAPNSRVCDFEIDVFDMYVICKCSYSYVCDFANARISMYVILQ
jgi:hypothetical protein